MVRIRFDLLATNMNKEKRTEIYRRLRAENPKPDTELNYVNPFELLIAVI